MSKESVLYESLLQSVTSARPLTEGQKSVLLVHSCLVSNGLLPAILAPSTQPGHVCLLPSAGWPDDSGQEGVYSFKYCGDIEVKCVQMGPDRLVVHASEGNQLFTVNVPTSASEQDIVKLVKANLVRPLTGSGPPPVHTQEQGQRAYVVSDRPPEDRRGFSPPRAPPFGTPLGPGELVGPNHPIFTGEHPDRYPGNVRDPRYDPLGPGFIGEPDTDHFPPPPFGQPPGGPRPPGRAPLRGPNANQGPGGMFM